MGFLEVTKSNAKGNMSLQTKRSDTKLTQVTVALWFTCAKLCVNRAPSTDQDWTLKSSQVYFFFLS